jgi:hypothetical protein
MSPDATKEILESIADTKRVIEYRLPSGENIPVQIKIRLDYDGVRDVVNQVCDSLFEPEYRPEYKDYFIRKYVIGAYTDLQLPEDDRDCHRLVYGTSIFARLTANEDAPAGFECHEYDDEIIDMEQYRALTQAIHDKINYILNKIQHT